MNKSRVLCIDPEYQRDYNANNKTYVQCCSPPTLASSWQGFEDIFLSHWHAIHPVLNHFLQPGLAMVAVHIMSKIVNTVCIAAKQESVNTAIVGRHSETDLYLKEDSKVSLRQMLAIALR